jgi:hypothetical protein
MLQKTRAPAVEPATQMGELRVRFGHLFNDFLWEELACLKNWWFLWGQTHGLTSHGQVNEPHCSSIMIQFHFLSGIQE